MIIELLFSPVFAILNRLVVHIPVGATLPSWSLDFANLLSKGLMFFPADVWFVVIGNVIFWMMAHMAWAIIEWLYKKLPGVD
ncbi:hypothetical protein QBE52_04860 [Clostridiaceae bacterium 35-E11]